MQKSQTSTKASPRSEPRKPITHRSDRNFAAAVRYSSTQSGLYTDEQNTDVISEVAKHIGSGTIPIEAGRQASLLLNAVGKKLQLESLRMRAGVKHTANGNGNGKRFFLSA